MSYIDLIENSVERVVLVERHFTFQFCLLVSNMSNCSGSSGLRDSLRIDGVKCPKDPQKLMDYADEFVSVLLWRLTCPCMSYEDRCEVEETLKRLMGRVLCISREGNSETDHFIRKLEDHVNREISRIQDCRLLASSSDPILRKEYELFVDVEDRVLGMIEEMGDPGLGSGQLSLNKSLIRSALSEMKRIRSASAPLFRAKVEELNAMAEKAIREIDVSIVTERSETPSEFRDHLSSLHFWEDEFSLFHLDQLFYEPNESC